MVGNNYLINFIYVALLLLYYKILNAILQIESGPEVSAWVDESKLKKWSCLERSTVSFWKQ